MNQQSKSESQQTVPQIPFSPVQMSTEKSYKQIKMKEIISAVCALLNNKNGGKLLLKLDKDTDNELNQDVIDNCIRMIEQWLKSITGVITMASHIKLSVKPHGILIEIPESDRLITVNYNLYLPSKSQVLAVPPTESPEAIKNILQSQRNIVKREDVTIGSHLKWYIKDQHTRLAEHNDTEFKSLRTTPSKCVTLADRITGKSNKLTAYVSGFANQCGGHIYYGINNTGVVEGESITDEREKDEIIKKVANTINKMVWPQNSSPSRGVQWDIFFEPVHDKNSNVIPSTFVIVLYVAPCPGGVFVDVPESYHLVEGKVQKISFQDWWRKFTGVWRRDGELCSVPSQVSRVAWSSEKNRTLFRKLSERLLQHRNDDDMKAFRALSKLARERFPESDVELIIIAQEIPASYKQTYYQKAMSSLEEFAELLKYSKDSSIFEVRMVQLKSMIESSMGNYEESYELAQSGLQMMELTPVEVHTVWFYIEAAMIKTIIMATSEQGFKTYRLLKDSALECITCATTTAKSLVNEDHSFEMSDLKKRLHIYKAWVLLECAITGDINVVGQKLATRCTYEDIQAAARELACVSADALGGSSLSCFRQIEYRLAECDLFRRRSEVLKEDYVPNLKKAFESASKAQDLAKKHHFQNMINYANKRLADLTEKLVLYAVQTRGKLASWNFLGVEY